VSLPAEGAKLREYLPRQVIDHQPCASSSTSCCAAASSAVVRIKGGLRPPFVLA
jgi:hypothetical protein